MAGRSEPGCFDRTHAHLDQDGRLLHEIAEADLTDDPAVWARFLTRLLHGSNTTNAPLWAVDHYLKDIVQTLKAADPTLDLTKLIEQAMRLGRSDAPAW